MKVCRLGLGKIWVEQAEGIVKMCGWTNYSIGNLTENSIEELWNGRKARIFRESMLDGSYRFCKKHECPYCSNDTIEYVEYEELKYPRYVSLSYEQQCNYVCKFCRKDAYVRKKDEDKKLIKIEHEIQKFIGHLNTISANGIGEIFCSPSIIKLLSSIENNQDISVAIESNGSLFNVDNWNKIKNLAHHNLKVSITVHSFKEDTYQFLSGTKLPVKNIVDNLHFISGLRKQKLIDNLEIAIVVCERNFRELPGFVKKCLDEFDMDTIRLRFFYPYKVMDRQTEWFYDIRNPHHPYYSEFVKVMQDPVFENKKVWKWQGDAVSVQKESPYVLEHKNFLNISELIIINHASKRIERYLKQKSLNKIALYGGSKAGRAYIRILQSYGMNIDTIFDMYEKEEKAQGYNIVRPILERMALYEMIIVTQETLFDEIKRNIVRMNYQGKIERMESFISDLKSVCFEEHNEEVEC